MQNPKKLSDKQFEKFKNLVKEKIGVNLNDGKRELLQAKVSKLMRDAEIYCYDKYYETICSCKGASWKFFVDNITIHKTNFFREDNHFNFIRDKLNNIFKSNPRILQNKEIRVWSSACSTGDEAYTLAMVLKEYIPPEISIKILATDVSSLVIQEAQTAEYVLDSEDIINPYFLQKYFKKTGNIYKITDELKNIVTFRTFNLMSPFPFINKFDIIFCRNVMIYFDIETQEKLIKKFYDVTTPGGLLFIGHSESLNQRQYKFKYLQPTIYIKNE